MPEKKKSISSNKSGVKSGNCPLYKKCGGCQLQNLTYEQQLRYKQVKCIRLLGKFCRVGEIIGMENPITIETRFRRLSLLTDTAI